MRSILIVGASLAGLRAAEALRAEGFDGRLTILGAEREMPYDRPPLSKQVLLGAADAADIRLRVPEDLGAEWMLGRRATRLDLARRQVVTDTGEQLAFDGLVIATGSEPRRLPGFEPGRLAGLVELRTLADAQALRAGLSGGARVVLVGSGFIGVEVASAARALGAEVDVFTLDPPLAAAGPVISDVCSLMLLDHRVRVHLGRTIRAVEGTDRVEAVVLDDGARLPADLVVVAVGVRPATDWLEDSGLTLRNGVVCDGSCAVEGADGVVACGDIARWPNPLFGGMEMRVEHWTNAAQQAGAAARTLLSGGSPAAPYASVPSFWSDHFGVRLQSVGLPAIGNRHEVVEGSLRERAFVTASYRGEELVGASTYGMVRALLPFRSALARGEALAPREVPAR